MTDIRSLDDAVAYLRERFAQEKARKEGPQFQIGVLCAYHSGQYDAFGEAIEAITGKPAQDGGDALAGNDRGSEAQ